MEYQAISSEKYQEVFPQYSGSLEQMIYEPSIGQPENKQEYAVDKLFSGKTKTLKATVRELINEIGLRKNIHSDLVSRIDNEICKTGTYLHEINDVCERKYAEEPKFGRRRTQLENRITSLEQEKRTEEREFWKDSMFLRKYLMNALADYWRASNKISFLENET